MNALIAAVLGALVGLGVTVVLAGASGRRLGSVTSAKLPEGTTAKHLLSVVAVAGITLLITGWPVGALLAAGAAVPAPRIVGGRRERERSVARTEAIATWTEMVRDSISAAAGLEEAIASTATVAPEAIRPEVRLLVRRLERQSLPYALASFGDELAHPSGDLVVTALTIAAQTEASDLTSLLSRLAEAIRGEARMRIRVEVGRTRVRTASKVILGVVAATIGLLAILNRTYLAVYGTPTGQVVLLVIGAIFGFGGWLLSKMSELDLPERFTARSRGSEA